VQARYPETHIASWAAKRLIDAFETMIQPDEPVLDMQRLSEADPKGNA
jgi:hypothetical protein